MSSIILTIDGISVCIIYNNVIYNGAGIAPVPPPSIMAVLPAFISLVISTSYRKPPLQKQNSVDITADCPLQSVRLFPRSGRPNLLIPRISNPLATSYYIRLHCKHPIPHNSSLLCFSRPQLSIWSLRIDISREGQLPDFAGSGQCHLFSSLID